MDWKKYSFAIRSRVRLRVLKALEQPKTPSQIAKSMKYDVSTISKHLKALEKKSIVKCLTPNVKKGKVYKLTETGVKILKTYEKSEE